MPQSRIFPCFLSLIILWAANVFVQVFAQQAATPLQTTSATMVRVFLRDKGPETFAKGSRIYEQTRALHSERALRRRAKVLPENELLSLSDAPVFEPYLDSLRRRGAQIVLRLRWRNYVIVTGANLQFEELRRLPFVRGVQSARERLQPLSFAENTASEATFEKYLSAELASNCATPNYGDALRQLATVSIPQIHALGISGQNVVVGVMDSGFRWKEQTSLKGASILAEYDFIQNDTNTANQAGERSDQDAHGTECLSVIAGFVPESLIGAAFGAQYLLAKTEDLRYERNLEQDNYAAGLEWLEARGADVMTASLGYFQFDSTDESSPYSELDGRTAIVTQAVNEASKRGVICVIPAGNEGRMGFRTLSAPADADSAIVVGGIRADSLLPISFSSKGPTGDGRTKPDIAAQGEKVVQASTTGAEYRQGNGTSYATPIIAGGVALLLSAYPELKPWQVRNLLYRTASQARSPDNILGYGIANLAAAFTLASERYGMTSAPELLSYSLLESQRVGVSVLGAGEMAEAILYARFAGRQDFMQYSLGNGSRFANIAHSAFGGKAAEMYATVRDTGGRSLRIPRTGFLRVEPRITSLPCGINVSALPLELPQSVRESIFPQPASRAAGVANLLLSVSEPEPITYSIFTTLGQRISTSTINVGTGINVIPLNISNYAVGMYYIHIRYGSAQKMFRFIVQP